jgi:hypothetical protein
MIMTAAQMREVQMLRRRVVWFREFARLGVRDERSELDALADLTERQAREAWEKLVAKLH